MTIDSTEATALIKELSEINAPAVLALLGEGVPLFTLDRGFGSADASHLFWTLKPSERMLDLAATLRTGNLEGQFVGV